MTTVEFGVLPRDWPARPFIQGRCPACGLASVFVAEGGYLTCSNLGCTRPEAPDELLRGVHYQESSQP